MGIDMVGARELERYIMNDEGLYSGMYIPIIKTYSRKMQKGTYNHELAVKGFMNLVNEGARKYCRDFGGTVRLVFPKPTRLMVAKSLTDDFEVIYQTKDFDFM